MVIRAFNAELDYESVCQWWTAQKWPIMPKEALPQIGLIVPGICAGWLYKTDSCIAWMEWLIANPESDKMVRNECLNALIDGLSQKAKEGGFKCIFTTVTHQGLVERYKKHAFQVTDQSMTNMVRSL